ncbi:MAG: choice-of-anchor Q domain-containing protein [Dokdonella sp.]
MPFTSTALRNALMARQRRRPLVAALVALLACASPDMRATSAQVTPSTPAPRAPKVVGNCNDAGSGSLRDAVGHAVDGDTIDLAQLSCSVISLSTGAIVIGAQNLTLHGPGADGLLINSAGHPGDGVLYSVAGGTLKVQDLSVAFGSKYSDSGVAHGGCIFSLGNVELDRAHVYACSTHSTGSNDGAGGAVYAQGDVTLINSVLNLGGVTVGSGNGKGGGVFAGGDLTMTFSSISDFRVATPGSGRGGGAYAGGRLISKYSTISNNLVDEVTNSSGGGVSANRGAAILFSTISGNHAHVGGGLYLGRGESGDDAIVYESTLSGNTAIAGGGMTTNVPLSLYNSTVVFNTIPYRSGGTIGTRQGAGLDLRTSPVRIDGSIIAGNLALGTPDRPRDVGGELSITVTGSHNLINDIAQVGLTGTINADPLLGPLRRNGGVTATHALLSGSPAINAGNNTRNFATDQRGNGFPRVLGGVPDIGGYKVDPDRIFVDGFE